MGSPFEIMFGVSRRGAEAVRGARRFARLAGVAAALIGATVLVGWWLGIPALTCVLPRLPPAMPNTGLALVLAGCSLCLLAAGRPSGTPRRLAQGGAILVTLIGLATLVEYATSIDLRIDRLLFDAPVEVAPHAPGRPAANTAAGLVLLGAALLLLDLRPRRGLRVSDFLSLGVTFIALGALAGHLFGVEVLYGRLHADPHAGMALPTSLALFLLGLGALAARPEAGVAAVLFSAEPAGPIVRRLLGWTLTMMVLGLLVVLGQAAGLYKPPVTSALTALVGLVVAVGLIVATGGSIERAMEERRKIEGALRGWKHFFDHAAFGAAFGTPDGRFILVNPAFAAMQGRTVEELIDTPIAEVFAPHRRAEVAAEIQRVHGAGHHTFESEHIRKDGTVFPVVVDSTAVRDAEGRILYRAAYAQDISARKQAEAALRRSEQRFRALVEQAPDGIFIADLDGRYIEVNSAGCRLLGATPEEILGRTIMDLIPPEDVSRLAESREALLVAGATHVAEWRLRHRDGTLIPVEVNARILPDGRWQAIVRDIRERKRAEAALAAAFDRERRLRRQIEQVSASSMAVSEAVAALPGADLRAVLQVIVVEAQALTGAQYGAIGIGEDPTRPFDPWVYSGISDEDAAAIGRHPRPIGLLGTVARAGRPVRLRDLHAHPDSVGFPAHHPAMTSLLGVPIRFHGRAAGNLYLANKRGAPEFSEEDEQIAAMLAARVASAIESARLYETEALAQAWLRGVVDQMPEAVVMIDAQGRRVGLNRAAQALALEPGEERDPGGNPVLFDVRRPSGEPLPWEELPVNRAVTRGEPVLGEELLIRGPDGRMVPVLASAAVVRGAGARNEGAVAVFRDVSVYKELERLREEWTSVVAHDLRQPVGVIRLTAESVPRLHQGPMPEKERQAIARIRRASERLTRMIDDLLDVSRIEARHLALDRRALALGPLVREILDHLAPLTAGHAVEIVEGRPAPPVWVDPDRLEQVIGNLVSNAVKYGAPFTSIRIEVGPSDVGAEVAVTNRGPGMAAEELPYLFDRFVRSAAHSGVSGIGLGLYIARGLVEVHGGRIWAESVPGETTTFRFTLPAAAPEP